MLMNLDWIVITEDNGLAIVLYRIDMSVFQSFSVMLQWTTENCYLAVLRLKCFNKDDELGEV